jgi:DNA repair protein RAD5
MDEDHEKERFFDHSLQTVIPNIHIPPNNEFGNQIKFTKLRDELKLLFTEITDTTIHLLYRKYSDSPNYIQDAINEYLDLLKDFSTSETNIKINPRQIKIESLQKELPKNNNTTVKEKYEYKSRKRSLNTAFNGGNPNSNLTNSFPISAALTTSKPKTSKKRQNTLNDIKPIIMEDQNDSKNYWKKYIGTFNISCWCTRSVYNLSSIFADNRLIFSKPQGSDVVYVNQQSNNSKFKRELGRITEGLAEIIGPLMDEKAIVFESKLFFIEEERLSTGDSFVIRTDCFLSEQIFESDNLDDLNEDLDLQQIKIMKDANGNINAGSRLKSLILKLFDKVGLKSVKEMKNKKKVTIELPDIDGDIEFEELQENRNKLHEIDSEDDTQLNTNGTDLTFNQVKDLYESTKLNIIQQSLPESIPSNFSVELRPYQKQGLSWMLQREKEYDLVGLNNDQLDCEQRDLVIQQLKSAENSVNPLWKEYTWPVVPSRLQEEQKELPKNMNDSFYVNLYKGTCSIIRPLLRSSCKGGILADEMGLGKTITALSLVMSFPKDIHYEALPEDHPDKVNDYAYKTTLIVLPMALLTQWEREFMKVAKDLENNRCFIYYGLETLGDLKSVLCGPNPPVVVLTTYGTIQSEWSRMDKTGVNHDTGLFSIKFLRIILDEGHNIRNKATKTARAIYSLRADRKWILTGTPIINRLEDLFSLVHFLELRPWSYHSLWKRCISLPFDTGKDVDAATELLKSVLDPILLRRTKNQKDNSGNYLVVLPPKEVSVEKLTFNRKEETIYNWLKEKAVNSFNENFKSGLVFKNYSSILTQLLRLRQVCCHVDLIKTNDADAIDDLNLTKTSNLQEGQQKLSSKVDDEMLSLVKTIEINEKQQRIPIDEINKLKDEIYEQYPTFDDIECSICTEPINIDTCIITECRHCFCLSCLTEHFEFQSKHDKHSEDVEELADKKELMLKAEEVFCPMCRKQINKNRLFRTLNKNGTALDAADLDVSAALLTQKVNNDRLYYVRPFTPNEQSSKINALLIHLEQIRHESPGEHIIVFSQFTSFLDLIEKELEKYVGEFSIFKFDGRLNLEQRQKVLTEFEKPVTDSVNKVSILLLSLKAGGVGLNLTVASRAFLMDPHWNNAIEFQAIDRIHRVGQMKNVKVVRFIMENSIEERMLEIQERKNQLGEALSITDEERRKRKLEELQSIFQE